MRETLLITSSLRRCHALLAAAKANANGLNVLSPAQLAARLAGGFLVPIYREDLQNALQEAIASADLDLGDLKGIRDLPGLIRATAATLSRAWLADIDLQGRAAGAGHTRLSSLARIESDVLRRLPSNQTRPADLVEAALGRLQHAGIVLGSLRVEGVPDLDPVWRPLLRDLAEVIPVKWQLEHIRHPEWIDGSAIEVEVLPTHKPHVRRVSCANPRHEVLEALRWARELISSGNAAPQDIAIAAPSTHEWDSHFSVMAADANLPLAFVHGRHALDTRPGQAAAALAEVLLAGISRSRMQRLLRLVRGMTGVTATVPADWGRILPREAPLLSADRWVDAVSKAEAWPDGCDFSADLLAIVRRCEAGAKEAPQLGEWLLSGQALAIWRKALNEGPAQALDVTLTDVRIDDKNDPSTSVVWCTAADAASSPRPFTRLLGLTSRGWPRTQSEDPLLPAYIVVPAELNPVPVPERDRRDFRSLLQSVAGEIVLSRARRDSGGRQNGSSALLRETGIEEEVYLRRERVPMHAASEADRLLARPEEFAQTSRAQAATACWHNWHRPELTPHDGLVRPNHPVLTRTLAEAFSASRLRMLVRDPLGFVWRYALRWDAPEETDEPLSLDPLSFGSLTHRILDIAVGQLEAAGGFASADNEARSVALDAATEAARAELEGSMPVPPRLIWRRTLDGAREQAALALNWADTPLQGQQSFAEVPFGGLHSDEAHPAPWDTKRLIAIPGTPLQIRGKIDRLDLAGDRGRARVTDYKTGKPPRNDLEVGGGAELQRCLYAYAVQVLLGEDVAVEARLLYTRDDGLLLGLQDPAQTMRDVTNYFIVAHGHLLSGLSLVGPDSGQRSDNALTFALPGNAKDVYLELKQPLAAARLAPLPELWERP